MSKRTTFYFPTEAAARLHSIMSRSHLDNGADAVRASLAAYDELLGVTEARCGIVVRDKKNREWPFSPHIPFRYPGLTASKRRASGRSAGAAPKNFVFSAKAAAKLDSIRSLSRLQSNADVIKVALQVFDDLISVVFAGDSIVIRDPKGHEQFYNPYIPLARPALEPTKEDERRPAEAKGSRPSREDVQKPQRRPVRRSLSRHVHERLLRSR
jgi:hypothetical protein